MIVNVGVTLSDLIMVLNDIKQNHILAPALFATYFAIGFQIAFKDCTEGVYM